MKWPVAAGLLGTVPSLVLLFGVTACHRNEELAEANPPKAQPSAPHGRHRRNLDPVIAENLVSHLLSDSVENDDGKPLGEVKDLLVEAGTGSAVYVMVTSGGFLSIGQKTVAVPAKSISVATTLRNTLSIDISEARWKAAPTVRGHAFVGQLSGTDRMQEIARYFGQKLPGADADPPPLAEQEHRTSAPPTGRGTARVEQPRSPPHRLELTSELIGMTLINAQHEKLGKVIDLLVDLAGQKPTYAIVLTEHLLEGAEKIAIPFGLLHWANDKLLGDISPKTVELAQPFTEAAWRQNSHPTGEIYAFEVGEGR